MFCLFDGVRKRCDVFTNPTRNVMMSHEKTALFCVFTHEVHIDRILIQYLLVLKVSWFSTVKSKIPMGYVVTTHTMERSCSQWRTARCGSSWCHRRGHGRTRRPRARALPVAWPFWTTWSCRQPSVASWWRRWGSRSGWVATSPTPASWPYTVRPGCHYTSHNVFNQGSLLLILLKEMTPGNIERFYNWHNVRERFPV